MKRVTDDISGCRLKKKKKSSRHVSFCAAVSPTGLQGCVTLQPGAISLHQLPCRKSHVLHVAGSQYHLMKSTWTDVDTHGTHLCTVTVCRRPRAMEAMAAPTECLAPVSPAQHYPFFIFCTDEWVRQRQQQLASQEKKMTNPMEQFQSVWHAASHPKQVDPAQSNKINTDNWQIIQWANVRKARPSGTGKLILTIGTIRSDFCFIYRFIYFFAAIVL